jgi:hypothetical protein
MATKDTFESMNEKSFEARVNQRVCEMLTNPMSQFALVFAAMIHDVEYEVPNFQLVEESSDIAKTYNNKSCAEQNSIHSAWYVCYLATQVCPKEPSPLHHL